jgi:hypothetical protein
MQEEMKPIVVVRSKVAKRNYTRAADCRVDMDEVATRLGVKPERNTFQDGLAFPNRYRCIYIQLTNGRFAILTQTEMRQEVIEIGLELHNDCLFDEADLLEVISFLSLNDKDVVRMDNGFTWVPAQK